LELVHKKKEEKKKKKGGKHGKLVKKKKKREVTWVGQKTFQPRKGEVHNTKGQNMLVKG